MSIRGFTPFFKWGFSLRNSSFLVPLMSNNLLVGGEEAVTSQQILLPAHPIALQRTSSAVKVSPTTTPTLDSKGDHSTTSDQLLIIEKKDSVEKPANIAVEPTPCEAKLKSCLETLPTDFSKCSDEEIINLIAQGKLQAYRLEQDLKDATRAVYIRRLLIEKSTKRNEALKPLPFENYNYEQILGACCENVIGYIPVPVGVAGPLLLDNETIQIPMATTEGCLVASTSRGCKAISISGGATSRLGSVPGMTRAPVVKMPTIARAVELKQWIEDPANFEKISTVFNSTSRFGRLMNIKIAIAGLNVFIRFKSQTGDAMGMNIVSKGVEKVMEYIQQEHPDMVLISISGNYCTDKKPSSINWTEGRGRSVIAEAVIQKEVVSAVLKTSVDALIEVNISKNLIGSAMAGSVGGFNAHAANLVTAVFLATGQDVAQNVESSTCITLMEKTQDGDLHISVTMPSVEVGTVGGGTFLPAQSSCLALLGIKGPAEVPGAHADKLARIVCATVLAGELSLMAALTAGHLMKSHLRLNRKSVSTPSLTSN